MNRNVPGVPSILFLCMTALFSVSCTLFVDVSEEFGDALTAYTRFIRWGEFDRAGFFADESVADEFRARLRDAHGVKIVELRVVDTDYDEERGEATVSIEMDYYLPSSMQVRTLTDVQQWVYREGRGGKRWRLVSLPPVFR